MGSTRLDDLQCAYGTLEGFLAAEGGEKISVYCVFDNEEVGSSTKQELRLRFWPTRWNASGTDSAEMHFR